MAHNPSTKTNPFANLGKKLIAIAVSYELITYALATVQAVGLTLPAMVTGGPSSAKVHCQANMQLLLSAAEEWKTSHPGVYVHRPKLSELKAYLATLPQCPDGGHYEMVYAGQSLKLADSGLVVVPEDRVAVRCVHDQGEESSHGGAMSNPFSN